MSRLLSVATAVPRHRLEAAEGLEQLRHFWPQLGRLPEADAAVGTRYLCEPIAELLRPRSLRQLQAAYLAHSRELALAAARKALRCGRLTGEDIDLVVTVSCTGYAVPSLDVHLAPELGLRPDVLRLPITELGCSGGAAAIAFAHRHLTAFPDHKVLVLAVELPSLNFQPSDASPDNLTAALVFGDGAGAAVLGTAPDAAEPGLDVLRAGSRLVPGTADLLGFDLRDGGFHVVLDRRLPRVVERTLSSALQSFLGDSDPAEVDFYAVHAAGPRIFEAIERALGLPGDALRLSREVFKAAGNTSSAAIFFTLERLIADLGCDARRGLGIGLGPGVSIELMELAWTPSEKTGNEPRPAPERVPVGG
jgi:predicted naringenin-chalcone synthase